MRGEFPRITPADRDVIAARLVTLIVREHGVSVLKPRDQAIFLSGLQLGLTLHREASL